MTAAVPPANPALAAFVAQLAAEFVLAQVLIRRAGSAFELRHVADRLSAPAGLRAVDIQELRIVARYTERGEFRPLKSAPNLVAGWRAVAADASELGGALDQLYPGAVADWFAAREGPLPVTSYRDFAARQTGMYRMTTRLDDDGIGRVVRACCAAGFCLKRRLWPAAGLVADGQSAKSAIPCLEPCALFLDKAREEAREDQRGTPRD